MEAPELRPEHAEELPETSAPDRGGSAPLDEINAAPEPTHMHHDTPEDLMSDKSSSPEGHNREHADKTEVDS